MVVSCGVGNLCCYAMQFYLCYFRSLLETSGVARIRRLGAQESGGRKSPSMVQDRAPGPKTSESYLTEILREIWTNSTLYLQNRISVNLYDGLMQ